MKKLTTNLLIILFISISFSCSKDNSIDDDTTLNIGSLLGVWKLTASSQNGINYKLTECDLLDLIIFDETNIIYVYNKSGKGNKCSVQTLNKSYTLRDNIITEEDGTEITIQQLFITEPSSLIIEFEEVSDNEIIIFRETYIKKQY
ncbi:lipocalin family protein [uncultured Lacinutrix sp.]|uniref:lipocalin family protein n=1 Tax=uncultured Lacinutrix sp. TaxID=574032 RepID=UPI002630E6AB|nr:lipocalin family protein [uncultured Lacinutrix sp.]